jgi:3'(2'), 5'-bisphosphate nucleotidase
MTENNPAFVPAIKSLLEKAAKAILEVYRSDNFSTELKADNSPLTRADTISNNIIVQGLKTITPEIPVISEETCHLPYEERKLFREVWILDPIDGTKEFVSRNDEFCICLALVRNTRPVAGFILAPVTGELWYAIEGEGSYCERNNTTIRLPLMKPTGKITITRSRSHHNEAEKEWIKKIESAHKTEIIIQGSAIKFCRLAEGNSSVYPKFGSINEWDVAAGDIILSEAGGKIIETGTGTVPHYNKPDLKLPHFIAYAPGADKLI